MVKYCDVIDCCFWILGFFLWLGMIVMRVFLIIIVIIFECWLDVFCVYWYMLVDVFYWIFIVFVRD